MGSDIVNSSDSDLFKHAVHYQRNTCAFQWNRTHQTVVISHVDFDRSQHRLLSISSRWQHGIHHMGWCPDPSTRRSYICKEEKQAYFIAFVQYRAPSLNRTSCCNTLSSSSVVSRAFSALCVYSKFGHHPHPLGCVSAKFHFFCSPTHSPSLFDVRGTKAFASEFCWLLKLMQITRLFVNLLTHNKRPINRTSEVHDNCKVWHKFTNTVLKR